MFWFKKTSQYKYHIEQVSLTHFEGWAFSKEHRQPCRVVIETTDRDVVAEGTTSIPRPDLENRPCGFRIPVKGKLMDHLPGRFLVFVDGVKVANCHVVLPVKADWMLDRAIEERTEALVRIRTERLEREVEELTRRLAELEDQQALIALDAPLAARVPAPVVAALPPLVDDDETPEPVAEELPPLVDDDETPEPVAEELPPLVDDDEAPEPVAEELPPLVDDDEAPEPLAEELPPLVDDDEASEPAPKVATEEDKVASA